jgi:hypothetical protein
MPTDIGKVTRPTIADIAIEASPGQQVPDDESRRKVRRLGFFVQSFLHDAIVVIRLREPICVPDGPSRRVTVTGKLQSDGLPAAGGQVLR